MKANKIKATLLITALMISVFTVVMPIVSAAIEENYLYYDDVNDDGDTLAEWVSDESKIGDWSVHLLATDGDPVFDEAQVVIPVNIDFGNISTVSYWFKYTSNASYCAFPYLVFAINNDGDPEADEWVVMHSGGDPYQPANLTWINWDSSVDDTKAKGNWFFSVMSANNGTLSEITGLVSGTVIAVKVAVGNTAAEHLPTEAWIDDIEINGITYSLEYEAVTITPDLVATRETIWFDIEVENSVSEASLYKISIVYPITDDWTFVDVLPPTGWMIDEHDTGNGVLMFKSYGSGLAPEASSTFQFKMITANLTDTTTIYYWFANCTDTGENIFVVFTQATVDNSAPDVTLDAPDDTMTNYSVGNEDYLWLNLTVTDDVEYLPIVELNDTRFELYETPSATEVGGDYVYEFCYVNNVAIEDGPLAVWFNVTDYVGNWYNGTLPSPDDDVSALVNTTVDNTAPIITIMVFDAVDGEELPKVGGMYYMGAELDSIWVNYTGIDNAFDPDYSYVYINDTVEIPGTDVLAENASTPWEYSVIDIDYLVINVTITDTSLPQNHTTILLQEVIRDLVGPHEVGFTEVETICGGLIVRGLYAEDTVGVFDYIFYMNASEETTITKTDLLSTAWTSNGSNGIAVLDLTDYAGDLVNITVIAEDYGLNPSDEVILYEGLVPEGTWSPIELYEGYNLMSLPLIPDSPAREDILSLILDQGASAVTITYEYDQYNDVWIMNPDEMTDGWGYWLYLNDYDVLIVEGEQTLDAPVPPATYEYTEGWVLGGYKEAVGNATNYFESFEALSYLGYVYVWDASPLTWRMVAVTDPMDLYPGQGFWIWMHEDQFLIPPIL